MTNSSKVVSIIVVIAVLGAVIWAATSTKPVQPPVLQPVATTTEKTASSTAVEQQAPLDMSDASISADLKAADSQLDGLNSDNANADKAAANQ